MDSSRPAASRSEQRSEAEEQWGALTGEVCRYCHKQGGVQFWMSTHPLDLNGPQVVRCVLCGNVWDADGSLA